MDITLDATMIVRLLLDAGAEANKDGETALHLAVLLSRLKLIGIQCIHEHNAGTDIT